jgi:hypothetical protein
MDDPRTAERGTSDDAACDEQAGDYQLNPKQQQRDHDHSYDDGCHDATDQHLNALKVPNIDSGNGPRGVEGLFGTLPKTYAA